MAWNGLGVFNLNPSYSPEINGTVIDATRYNGLTSDIAAGITAALAKNGENVPTANLPMGGFKHTGVANATASGQYVNYLQAQDLVLNLGSAALPSLYFTGDANTGIYSPGADQVAVSTGGVQRIAVGAAGNVNIATPSSGTALIVDGIIQSNRSGSSDGVLLLGPGANNNFLYSSTSSGVSVSTNNVLRFIVNNAGNVSIAAPSSGSALSVATTTTVPVLNLTASAALNTNWFNAAGSTTGYQYGEFTNTSGRMRIGVEGSVGGELLTGAPAYATILGSITASDLSLGTQAIERLRINSQGNVTIVTPSSGATLTLAGNDVIKFTNAGAGRLLSATAATTSYYYADFINTSGYFRWGLEGAAGSNLFGGAPPYSAVVGTQNATSLILATDNITRITLAAAGNVTIAAPSSGNTLTVAGDTAINVSGAGAAVRLMVAASATTGYYYADFANTSGYLRWGVEGAAGSGILSGAAAYASIIATLTATNLSFGTNSAERIKITSAGNVTINAPSSGIGLTQTGFAGSDTALFNGGTSGSFRVTDRGLPYGTSIHNNAGAVTGTTNQYIASGTYTPTLANVANVAATGAYASQWMRVGNVVTVSGFFDIDPTSASTLTTMTITLPIAASSAVAGTLGGVAANNGTNKPTAAMIYANSTTTARVEFTSGTDVTNQGWSFTFTYVL